LNKVIGSKVKELRTQKKMTLKELSEKTNLSTGFLSQLERGLTSIATDSLLSIAEALEVELSYFFSSTKRKERVIQRSYEREVHNIDNCLYVNYVLSNSINDKTMLPRLIEILPNSSDEELSSFHHEGEEFIYVLEGILTLFINNEKQNLHPGDCAHLDSKACHNFTNYTNKITKILIVSIPNHLNDSNK